MRGRGTMRWQKIRQVADTAWTFVARHRYKLIVFIFIIGGGLFALNHWRLIYSFARHGGLFQLDSRIKLLGCIALILVLVLWLVPKWQVGSVYTDASERFKQANEARKTLAQILGGLAFLGGLYFTSETLRTAQDGQVTDRFTKAIAQLGDRKLEIRLGGIYALERIARDSEKDYWPVMEILTAYVRERSPWKNANRKKVGKLTGSRSRTAAQNPEVYPTPPTDVQAVLTVLGRRERRLYEQPIQVLDLNRTDLRGANLGIAHLESAILFGAHLEGAILFGARLEGANLNNAHLEGANLSFANLDDAGLIGAHLEGANLTFAYLMGADLWGADLQKADIQGADFEGANIEGANLRQLRNLFPFNIRRATAWDRAFYDPDLLKQLDLPTDHNEKLKKELEQKWKTGYPH